MQVVPDERFPPQSCREILGMINCYILGYDFRTGPKDVYLRQEFPPNRRQVVFAAQFAFRHPPAIRRRTEKEAPARTTPLLPLEHDIGHMALRGGKRTPTLHVIRVHTFR